MILASGARANVADFDGLPLAANSYWNGGPAAGSHPFVSGPATFNNSFFYDAYYDMTSWAGWAYSNKSDATTPDWTNQYSAITGAGHSGANYAVGYMDTWNGVNPTVTLATPSVVDFAWFTNTTYSYYSIRDGTPPYGKKFGDAPDPDDWFLLTITGMNAAGTPTGVVNFYLADYRFANNANDYIVKDWTLVDLASLGAVKSLEFTLTSSDTSFGMLNNPAYFAMDTLTVSPEPATLGLVALGLAALARRRRAASVA
jgi:hypothetical protein